MSKIFTSYIIVVRPSLKKHIKYKLTIKSYRNSRRLSHKQLLAIVGSRSPQKSFSQKFMPLNFGEVMEAQILGETIGLT